MTNGFTNSERCPKCRESHLTPWAGLSDEERVLAERLPKSAEYALEARKQHRFCTLCWFEETSEQGRMA